MPLFTARIVQNHERNLLTSSDRFSDNRQSGVPYGISQWLRNIGASCGVDTLAFAMALASFEQRLVVTTANGLPWDGLGRGLVVSMATNATGPVAERI